jgi:hypothetical protein
MIIEGVVNPPSEISFSDGDDIRIRAGKTSEFITTVAHAQFYDATYWGHTFHGYSMTPTTIPITSTTSPTFILWNPRGSGRNLVLVKYCMGYAANKSVEGNVQLGIITGLGSTIATGAAITAFTVGPVINGKLGSGAASVAKFGIAATIVAATQFLSLSLSPMQLSATSSSPAVLFHEFQGTIIVPPGVAVFTCASAASVATYNERMVWYEHPE